MSDDKEKKFDFSNKKIVSYIALFFSLFLFLIVLVISILGWITLDNIEKTITPSIDNICGSLNGAIVSINSLSDTTDDIKNSINYSSASLLTLSDSLSQFANITAIIDKNSSNDIKLSSEKMKNASYYLSSAVNNIDKIKEGLSSVRSSLVKEKETLCDNKIRNSLGNLRLLLIFSIIFAFLLIVVFSLNSIANLL